MTNQKRHSKQNEFHFRARTTITSSYEAVYFFKSKLQFR